jgi:hypothetical protein
MYLLSSLYSFQARISVKGDVKDAVTGQPVPNTVIHVKNIMAGRDDDIPNDVTSGEFIRLNKCKTEELISQPAGWLVT